MCAAVPATAWPRRSGGSGGTGASRLAGRDRHRRTAGPHPAGPGRRPDGRTVRRGRSGATGRSARRGRRGDRRAAAARARRCSRPPWHGPHRRPRAILVDVDPWSGGIDLVLGSEAEPGLRWPDLDAAGRAARTRPALREALPRAPRHQRAVGWPRWWRHRRRTAGRGDRRGQSRRSHGGLRRAAAVDRRSRNRARRQRISSSSSHRPTCGPALRPRRSRRWVVDGQPERRCGRAGARAGWSAAGRTWPSIVGLPLLAAMRPQPGIAEALEHGGLRLRRRSPLAAAARRVLAVLQQHPTQAERGMSASLIERVRERLAAESGAAAAQRGRRGDPGRIRRGARRHRRAEQSAGAADRAHRRGHPRTAAAAPRDHRRAGHRARRGLGRRRYRVARAARFGSPTKPRCADWRNGWRWPPGDGWTTRSPGSTGTDRARRRPVHRPAARGAAADRAGGHLPVAAGAAARHPGSGRAGRGRAPSPAARGRCCDDDHRARAWRSWSPAAPARERRPCWRRCWARSPPANASSASRTPPNWRRAHPHW